LEAPAPIAGPIRPGNLTANRSARPLDYRVQPPSFRSAFLDNDQS
jgi:hypothetical protein